MVEVHGKHNEPDALSKLLLAKLENGMFWNTQLFWKENTRQQPGWSAPSALGRQQPRVQSWGAWSPGKGYTQDKGPKPDKGKPGKPERWAVRFRHHSSETWLGGCGAALPLTTSPRS